MYDTNARPKLPSRHSGQKAHYGIVVGILIGLESASEEKPLQCLENEESLSLVDDADTVYLLVQHSLSSKLSIATWSDFMESNQQLVSVDEGKFGRKDLNLKDRIIICRGFRPGASD